MVGALTAKQAAFVAEYLVDMNATQAAIRAGYSEKSAYRIGSELRQKTSVAKAITQAQAKRAAKVGREAEDVLRDIQDVTKDARNAGDLKTALKGLELEGKHLGMFKEKVEADVSGEITLTWQK